MVAFPLPEKSGSIFLFKSTLFIAGCFLLFVAWDQSHWWVAKADYSFGWLVPFCVAYTVYDRWPRLTRLLNTGYSGETYLSRARVWNVFSLLAGLTLFLGSACFLLGAAYRAATGPSNPGTLAITGGTALIILSSFYLAAPTDESNERGRVINRLRLINLFMFPVLVWLISAPVIGIVEAQLNIFLMKQVTSSVFFVFNFLGLPLEQRGNVLILPTGSVGIAEACSGIRSLTGCLFAGSFLAAMFIDRWWRKLILVCASLALALSTNFLRSLFLTSWSYRYGADSMEKNVHDLAGYAVLGLTTIGLLLFIPLLNSKKRG